MCKNAFPGNDVCVCVLECGTTALHPVSVLLFVSRDVFGPALQAKICDIEYSTTQLVKCYITPNMITAIHCYIIKSVLSYTYDY
jgi:hypothetical protein